LRRLLSGPAGYLVGLGRATARGWDAFFFTPADPTPLGLVRLAVGLLAFWSLLVYGLDLPDYLGGDGWADPEAVRLVRGADQPYAWSFWFAVPDALLRPVWVGCLAVLGLFAAGAFSRVTAVLSWVIIVSTARRVPVSLYGFDQALSGWLFYLAVCGASGRAVSLDRLVARWREARAELRRRRPGGRPATTSGVPEPSVAANLGLRLIQLHLCLIYLAAGLAKLQGPAWWNGTAVWGTLSAGEFRLFDLTWLAAYPLVINAMTHAGLAFELGYTAAVWVRPVRPLVLASAAALHVGAGLTLGLTEFGLAMLAGNLAFASGPWLRGLVVGLDGSTPAGRVLYDGACPKCRASVALIAAADPDRLVEPIDLTAVDVGSVHPGLTKDACLRSMHLVRRDGRVVRGYDAVATLARWLPPYWPMGVVGSLPGVTHLGRLAYNAFAARRSREGPCTDEVCDRPAVETAADRPTVPTSSPAAGRRARKASGK